MRALAALGSVATAFVLCACSGADGGNIFPTPAPDAAPPSVDNGDAGDLVNGPGTQEAAAPVICTPQSVASFQATWTPPEQWKQNVCSAAQVSGFYDACLSPPISVTNCQTFVQQNAACAPCLQSQETDAQASAVVWHEQKQYWTVNVAGCIARATGDATGAGCGAAYAAAIACRQQSCNACWAAQGTTTTFQQFSACEQQAGQSTCSTYAQAVPGKCGDLTTGPPSACMPPSGATAKIAYMQVAPLFCGP
ncbi:MAG TPA: hypothetical protein VIF15_08260 [Polyangiaceae bacterium]|jgi:hypothetical protein